MLVIRYWQRGINRGVLSSSGSGDGSDGGGGAKIVPTIYEWHGHPWMVIISMDGRRYWW